MHFPAETRILVNFSRNLLEITERQHVILVRSHFEMILFLPALEFFPYIKNPLILTKPVPLYIIQFSLLRRCQLFQDPWKIRFDVKCTRVLNTYKSLNSWLYWMLRHGFLSPSPHVFSCVIFQNGLIPRCCFQWLGTCSIFDAFIAFYRCGRECHPVLLLLVLPGAGRSTPEKKCSRYW